jgi:hypothetical protein
VTEFFVTLGLWSCVTLGFSNSEDRPTKKMIGRENLPAVRPPILDKSGPKILYEKYEFSHDLLAFVSNCH